MFYKQSIVIDYILKIVLSFNRPVKTERVDLQKFKHFLFHHL